MKKKRVTSLSPGIKHFDTVTRKKKGDPRESKAAKKYFFGHFTNAGKKYNRYGRKGKG